MLEEMLLGGLYTSCGQVPRLRELLNLECENSPVSRRPLFIWNGYIIYVIRHHKAKRQINQEFYVVRFLPMRLGVAMCRYRTCIRRLVDLLYREQQGCQCDKRTSSFNHLLFRSNGNSWKPARLTAILKKATLEVWGFEVNARVFRHLAIGISEKHVQEVHKPFN